MGRAGAHRKQVVVTWDVAVPGQVVRVVRVSGRSGSLHQTDGGLWGETAQTVTGLKLWRISTLMDQRPGPEWTEKHELEMLMLESLDKGKAAVLPWSTEVSSFRGLGEIWFHLQLLLISNLVLK